MMLRNVCMMYAVSKMDVNYSKCLSKIIGYNDIICIKYRHSRCDHVSEYPIAFSTMEWESVYLGQRQKSYDAGKVRLRLVELTDAYGEEAWCEQEHIGFILDGRITIEYEGKSISFRKGDRISIPSGVTHRHKGRIEKGETVQMIFFERM
jgi:cupin superfamily acireductone dioxygenase involved in methionine salvage